MATLDIKDLYVNLFVDNVISITKFWLDKHNSQNIITKQTLELIKVALNQNHFQYNDKHLKPTHGIAMGVTLIKYPSRDLFTEFQGTEDQTLDGNGWNNVL